LYQLTSFNIVNRTLRLDYEDGFVIVPLDELKRDYKVKHEKK